MKLVRTDDGSMSLRSSTHGILYHSHHGALTESLHVFIANGLDYRSQNSANPDETIRILEYGVGTGLNALLAYQWSMNMGISIEYVGLEIEPVKIWKDLAYVQHDEMGYDFFSTFHQGEWNTKHRYKGVSFTKVKESFLDYEPREDYFDVIFYDAFAPTSQEELWTCDTWQKCYAALRSYGVWVSYCAKGQVRRDLQSVGFDISRLPGPPGKREMLRAEKP